MKRCVIIAGGEFDAEFASSYIKSKYGIFGPELLVLADHGLDGMAELERLNPKLQAEIIIVGDYDSVEPENLDAYKKKSGLQILQYPAEKNYTDSHLALYEAIKAGAEEVTILGATGTRLDHVLANLGLLQICMEKGIPAELTDKNNRIHMINKEMHIMRETQFGSYVSLIPYTDLVTGVTLRGMKYPLRDFTFHTGIHWEEQMMLTDNGVSRGISNEIEADEAEITIEAGAILVIESMD